MTLKVTFQFLQGRYTPTESHYLPNYTELDSGVGAALAYAANRVRILGDYARLEGIRISHVNPATRVVQDIDDALFASGPVWPPDVPQGTYSSDIPTTSVLVRMQTDTPEGSKNWYIACCPDVSVETSPASDKQLVFTQPPGWSGYFATFMSGLLGTWAYRQISNDFPSTAQSLPVTSATYPQTVGIVVPATLNVAAGQQVYLTGWRRTNPRAPGLQGYYRVVGVIPPVAPATGPWTYFLSGTGNVSPTNFVGPGQIAAVSYKYPLYSGYGIVGALSHKRGGSVGLPRGRSRVGGR
jgi:hypothetical protein